MRSAGRLTSQTVRSCGRRASFDATRWRPPIRSNVGSARRAGRPCTGSRVRGQGVQGSRAAVSSNSRWAPRPLRFPMPGAAAGSVCLRVGGLPYRSAINWRRLWSRLKVGNCITPKGRWIVDESHQRCPRQRGLQRPVAAYFDLTMRTVMALERPTSSITATRASPAPSGFHWVPSSGRPSTSQ